MPDGADAPSSGAGCAAMACATKGAPGGAAGSGDAASSSVSLAGRRSPRRERRDQCDVACRDQNAVTAIGKIEPQAAAGRKPAGRRAKALQSLQPDGAVCRQPACEPRDLPPVPIGRSEDLFGKRCGVGCAKHPNTGRIGPQDSFAVGRPQPRGQGARRVGRQSRIAGPVHLKFRIIHRDYMTVRRQNRPPKTRQPQGIVQGTVTIARGERQVHGPAGPASFKAADNPNPAEFFNPAEPRAFSRVGLLAGVRQKPIMIPAETASYR